MSPLRWFWLLLTILGGVAPMIYFVRWFQQAGGFDLAGMVEAWNVNDAATGLVYDLTIAAVALTVFVLVDARRNGVRWGWVAIPATFCIGLSCGLPLYFFLREGRERAG